MLWSGSPQNKPERAKFRMNSGRRVPMYMQEQFIQPYSSNPVLETLVVQDRRDCDTDSVRTLSVHCVQFLLTREIAHIFPRLSKVWLQSTSIADSYSSSTWHLQACTACTILETDIQ